jgi:HPt (histidine-containing phosphotransfer) domain-containing protein
MLTQQHPDLQIILTLSPVRHTKEGIAENQLSKSLLRVLCAQLEQQLEAVTYFPAYEILVDELRDYRFYKSDLVHPSEEAENYIWEKWQQFSFSPETQQKVAEIQKIQLELAHRSFNPDSEAHRKFLHNLLGKLEKMQGEFDFSEKIQDVKSRLHC